LVLEEGAEIFGSLSFLIAVLSYIAAAVQPTKGNTISIKRIPLFSMIILFLGGTGFLMVLLVNTVPYFAGDFGLPDSWFPGILSLMIAVIAFISYKQPKRTSSPLAWLYIFLAIFCVFLSFYFGGYVPYWLEAAAENGIAFGSYFNYILAFITIVAGILLLIYMPTNLGRLLIIAGTALLVFALVSPYPTVFSLPYIALSTVLIAMLYRHFYLRLTQEKEMPSAYKHSQIPSSVHR
jgi:Ca2+/Na+ antiporter